MSHMPTLREDAARSADTSAPGRFEVDYLAPEGAVRRTPSHRGSYPECPRSGMIKTGATAVPAARNTRMTHNLTVRPVSSIAYRMVPGPFPGPPASATHVAECNRQVTTKQPAGSIAAFAARAAQYLTHMSHLCAPTRSAA